MKNIILVYLFLLLSACSSFNQKPTISVNRDVAQAINESKQSVLFSWTNNPLAVSKPAVYLQQQLDFAKNCLVKIAKLKYPVAGCEGNQLYAGPGLYTVDNPFTSYDYGNKVIILETVPGLKKFANAGAQGQASGGLSRKIIANPNNSAIVYDFRSNNYNTKALVVRSNEIISKSVPVGIELGTQGYHSFATHSNFQCTDKSTVVDILKNWGDQISFMSLTSFGGWDSSGQNFQNNGELNDAAYLAAFASDAVAVTDEKIEQIIAMLKSKFPEVMEESLNPDACQETSSLSPRACLSQRIYNSARNELGFGDKTTYAWDTAQAVSAFQALNLLDSNEVKNISTSENLVQAIVQKMKKNSAQIESAFECTRIINNKISKSHLGLWVNE